MRVSQTGFRLAIPETRRNLAIVRAVEQGLTMIEVARFFRISPTRVGQIVQEARYRQRFAREHAEADRRES